MRAIIEALEDFFRADSWSVERIAGQPGQPVLRMKFRGEHGEWYCYAQAWEKDRQFMFYSVAPVEVPEPKRIAMAEYLTRANYGQLIGNFEMDFSDGQVRYKTGFDVEKTDLTIDLIRPAVYANVKSLDKYLPGIMRVIYSGAAPADAIAEIEG